MSTITNKVDLYFKDHLKLTLAGPTLAKITKIDHKKYHCECVALTKKGEKSNTIFPNVPIPKFWATQNGGIFMAPSEGTIVLLNFLDNDIDYPIVSTIIGSDFQEESKDNTLIIKQGNTKIVIDQKLSIDVNNQSLGDCLKSLIETIRNISTSQIILTSQDLIAPTGPVTGSIPSTGINSISKTNLDNEKEKLGQIFE